jgi:hypothetical protein
MVLLNSTSTWVPWISLTSPVMDLGPAPEGPPKIQHCGANGGRHGSKVELPRELRKELETTEARKAGMARRDPRHSAVKAIQVPLPQRKARGANAARSKVPLGIGDSVPANSCITVTNSTVDLEGLEVDV